MVPTVEAVEAVIISGPRRGEIIRLPDEALPKSSDEEIHLLDAALDDLTAAVDRFADEVHTTTQALQKRVEAM